MEHRFFISAILLSFIAADMLQLPLYRPLPKNLLSSSKTHSCNRTVGSQPIHSQFDYFYTTYISIGTPRQNFTLLVDTGSDLLWTVSRECVSAECDGLPPSLHLKGKFVPENSTSFANESTTFSYEYASALLKGYYALDTVEFAGFIVEGQKFGLATGIDRRLGAAPVDGILGLAVPGEHESFLTNLLPMLPLPLFTVYLSRHPTPEITDTGGLLTLGGTDGSHCSEDVSYFPLTSRVHWQFALESISMGSYSNGTRVQAVSDTGSNAISGPRDAIIAMAKEARATYSDVLSAFTVDCNSKIDDIVFVIGGKKWNVPSRQFVLDFQLEGNRCILMLSVYSGAGLDGNPEWLLGQPFIRQYCQIYDIGNKRIGFAAVI